MRPHHRLKTLPAIALLLGLLACAAHPAPEAAPKGELAARSCFPVEQLSPEDRAVADRILLTMGDGEGLYTLAGGLKPVSSGMLFSVKVAPEPDAAALAALEQRRRVAARLTCGDVGVFTLVFAAPTESKERGTLRPTELVLYHRSAVADAIRRHAAFFTPLGITPAADPQEVLAAVEHAPHAERWRGYGYLYGYPDEAVDFFVTAGVEGDASGKLVPRDFRRIETFTKHGEPNAATPPLSTFVFAVPKGAPESEAERALRAAAAPVYARYVEARAKYVASDGRGAVALWRAWLSAGAATPR